MNKQSNLKTVFTLAAGILASGVVGVGAADSKQPLRTGADALGDWTTDAPGVRRMVTTNDLPAPFATKSTDNGPHMVSRPEGAKLKVPGGFEVDLLAEKLNNPRKIITAPNGDLFVVESGPGRIKVLRPGDDGKIISTDVFAEKLRQPFGMAFYPPGPKPKYLYVGNTDSVVRFAYENGDTKARGGEEMIVPDLPGGGRLRGGGHWTRDIAFSPDGKKMFVSVGSHSNVDDDAQEKNRADILQYSPEGKDFKIFASGIRNPVSLAIEPKTGELWTSVNERDGLGDDLVPDYITHVQEGGFYGWPWYYTGNHQDPRHAGKHPELADKVIVADVLLESHSASLCMTFYTGKQFPSEYRGMVFAAEHGSWNRSKRTGYKVICVPIHSGKAVGEYDDFLTGFVTESGDVWGRPVGVTVDKQGSLIVADDGSNSIWRIRYIGQMTANAGK